MYIKIVIREDEDIYTEHIYEATNCSYYEDDEVVTFCINGSAIHLSLDKSNTEIFIMNNNGIAIDTYSHTRG